MIHSRLDIIQHIYLKIKSRRWCRIYESLGGGSRRLYVCPYKGTGDVYMACSLLSTYLSNNKNIPSTIVTIGNSNKKVAELFSFDDIRPISQEDMDELMNLVTLLGPDSINVMVMHPDPPNARYGISDRMRNYNGFNFKDMFAAGTFGNISMECDVPTFIDCKEEAKDFFKKNGLIPGRTVILAPYVNTLGRLPEWVWIKLSTELMKKGYAVYTNCGGNETEIVGTIRLDVPYSKLKSYVECAGIVIASRSGLCEILSTCNARKIIIYQPNMFWGSAGNIDYFSLKTMNIDNDVIEIEYKGVEFLRLIEEIKAYL